MSRIPILFGALGLLAVAGCSSDAPNGNTTDGHVSNNNDATPPSSCGNGELDVGEACDDSVPADQSCAALGYATGEAACTACQIDLSNCADPICGDGLIAGHEDCDGTELGGATCQGLGFRAGPLACEACSFDTDGCIDVICGDGYVDGDEECDGANLNGQACDTVGFRSGSLACEDCALDTSACIVSVCGDGFVDGDEECDGANLGGGSCESIGLTPGGTLGCRSDCRYSITNCLVCGDGVCHAGERASTCPSECGVVDIAAGATHTCAVLADGSVWCWGARDGHRMGGTGDVNTPVRVPDLGAIQEIPMEATLVAAGEGHTCVVRTSAKEVWCWGRNGFGETGGSYAHEVFPPRLVPNVLPAIKLDAGRHHTCALASDNPHSSEVTCWGRGDYGAIGSGSFTLRNNSGVEATHGTLLTAGARHTCAWRASSGLFCWGSNERGQLESSNVIWRPTPYLTAPGVPLTALGGGDEHGCATLSTALYCWGNNSSGQVGVQADADHTALHELANRGAEVVTGGADYTCTIQTVPGPVTCWGGNGYGQLGDATFLSRHTSEAVAGITNAVKLAGGAHHVCALLDDQTVRCWGHNDSGQLGNRSLQVMHNLPVIPHGLD